MARKQEPSLADATFETLKHTPFWVGPTLAAVVFLLLYYVVPFLIPASKGGFGIGIMAKTFLPMFGWLLALMIMMTWIAAEVHKFLNRRLLDTQTGADSIRNLSWRDFERLVCEAYRRQGYIANTVGTASGDGGVDVELSRPGETIVVQCKQWRAYKVGVTTVRELLGVVVSRGATKGIIVTSGRFTQEAVRFADQNPEIELLDGTMVTDLVTQVRADSVTHKPVEGRTLIRDEEEPKHLLCPRCASVMVMRTARRGRNAGAEFWGCSKYPACRGTRAISP